MLPGLLLNDRANHSKNCQALHRNIKPEILKLMKHDEGSKFAINRSI